MRGIVIDPYKREIYETETDGSLKGMYEQISSEALPCDMITSVMVAERPMSEILWLHDEGLLHEDIPVWQLGDSRYFFASKGLILGCNEEGDNVGSRIPVEIVRRAVKWTDKLTTGDLTPSTERKDPDGTFVIHGGDPILKEKD
jgi:hypothetical protein